MKSITEAQKRVHKIKQDLYQAEEDLKTEVAKLKIGSTVGFVKSSYRGSIIEQGEILKINGLQIQVMNKRTNSTPWIFSDQLHMEE